MARVFISHASEDHELAGELHRQLTDDDHEVFLDQDPRDGITVGEDWEQRLIERLRWADAVICVVTSAYLDSWWCAYEVGIARALGSRLLPLLAEPGMDNPLLTATTQYADYAGDPLAAGGNLRNALRLVDAAGGWGWPEDRSPFPGLRPFDTDLHRVFFGRTGEVEALAGLLRSPAERAGGGLLVVVGPSGCGKSSLVRAGLLPVMANEPDWWTLPPLLPGADPVGALARGIAAAARQLDADWTLSQVRRRLDGNDGGLVELVEELLLAASDGGHRRQLLVVVDQLEELLTQTAATGRAHFAELLRPTLAGPVQVVATLRSEFLAELLTSDELAGLPTRVFPLRPLGREALRAVIEGPAQLAGIRVDEPLVTQLVADTDTGEALPLLAFTLDQLAEGAGRGGQLSQVRYDQLGGVQGALIRQANAALAQALAVGGRTRQEVLAGLLRLVTVDEQGNPTRWRVDREDLPESVRAELDPFITRRLVITDTENGNVVVRVAHEAFLSSWPPLAEAIGATVSALRMRRAVEQAAADWARSDRAPARLWERGQLAAAVTDSGARIRRAGRSNGQPAAGAPPLQRHRALAWLARGSRVLVTDKVELSRQARDFLHASIRVDRRRRQRGTTILSVLLMFAVVAAGIAVNRQRAAELQKRVAIAHGLAAQADEARDRDPRIALLLGIAAQHIHADAETQASLVNTLTATRYAGTLGDHSDAVYAVAFAPDGHTLASSAGNGTVTLWAVSDPAQPHPRGPPLTGLGGAVFSVAFAPDGRTLATGGLDQTLLWDVSDPARPRRLGRPLTGHDRVVNAVAFTPDGRTLASGSADGTMILWDVSDPARPSPLGRPLISRPPAGPSDSVLSVVFAPDGRTMATGAGDGTMVLWDVSDPDRPHPLGHPLTGPTDIMRSVAFAPDGRTLASSAGDGTVTLWDVSDRARPHRLGRLLTGRGRQVTTVAFAPDGHTLASGSDDSTVTLWDVSDRARPSRLGPPLTGHGRPVNSVAFAPDGHTLASGGVDGTVLLWDVSDRPQPSPLGQPLAGPSDTVSCLAFAPNGRTLASGSDDGTVTLWDVSDRARPHRLGRPLTGHGRPVDTVAFASDGHTLANGSDDGTVTLWDVSDRLQPSRLGRPLTSLPLTGSSGSVLSVALTPDGHTLASGSDDGIVTLWDVSDGAQPHPLGSPLTGHGRPVKAVAFASDGRRLASGSDDGTVLLWEVSDRARPHPLGHPLTSPGNPVSSVAFAPDGRTLASGGQDKTLLWDVSDRARPRPLGQPLTGTSGLVLSVALAPDGRTLASGSDDGTVTLWDLTELNALRTHAAQRACSLTGRGFNRDEWARYIPGLPYQSTCSS
jgi:WD40 repeat protein